MTSLIDFDSVNFLVVLGFLSFSSLFRCQNVEEADNDLRCEGPKDNVVNCPNIASICLWLLLRVHFLSYLQSYISIDNLQDSSPFFSVFSRNPLKNFVLNRVENHGRYLF